METFTHNGSVRHICAGHEYRYDVQTGAVRNNYGTHVTTLAWARFTPAGVPFIASLYRVTPHWPVIHGDESPIATIRGLDPSDHMACAHFAISHTAAGVQS